MDVGDSSQRGWAGSLFCIWKQNKTADFPWPSFSILGLNYNTHTADEFLSSNLLLLSQIEAHVLIWRNC